MSNLGDISNYVDENWYGGQIDGDFFEHPQMTIQQNKKVQEKKKDTVWNWQYVFTRQLMRGKHKVEILNKYKDIIKRFNIQEQVREYLNKNDGLIGYFVIDVSNFDDKFTYEDVPEQLRKSNLYALNSVQLKEVITRSLISQNDGSFDGFLNSDDSIDQEISYIDDITDLPCIDNIDAIYQNNDDERLDAIAGLFLGRKWITINEKTKFQKSENKMSFLISVVKRAFSLKSTSDSKVEDYIKQFNVKDSDLQADSQKSVKQAQVNNIHENKMDDIGNVAIPKACDIKKQNKKSDFIQDINLSKKIKYDNIINNQQPKMQKINTDDAKYEKIGDNIKQLTRRDYRDDFKYDDKIHQFIVQNIKDMKEDEFDYAELNNGDVDIDEMFDNESDKRTVNIKNAPQKIEFSKKFNTDSNVNVQKYVKDIDIENDYSNKQDVFFDNRVDQFIIDDIKDMKEDEFDYADLSKGDVDIDEMFDNESDKHQVDIDEAPQEVQISNKYDWSW